jgi:hypothetical protein
MDQNAPDLDRRVRVTAFTLLRTPDGIRGEAGPRLSTTFPSIEIQAKVDFTETKFIGGRYGH